MLEAAMSSSVKIALEKQMYVFCIHAFHMSVNIVLKLQQNGDGV